MSSLFHTRYLRCPPHCLCFPPCKHVRGIFSWAVFIFFMHRLHKFFYLWFSFVHTNVCESHLVSAVLGLGGIKQKRNREWKCWLGKRSGFVGFGWLLTVCILSPCNESSRRSSEATLRQFVDWPGFSWCFFRFFCFCPRRLRRLWCV